MQVTLPFPPKELHAHNKGHWRAKAVPVRKYRELAHAAAMASRPPSPLQQATISYDIYYPANRNYDIANTIQSLKPAVDGLVDAGWMLDDNWKVLSIDHVRGHLDREDPRVVLTVNPAG